MNTTLNIVLIWARTLLKTGVKAPAEEKKMKTAERDLKIETKLKKKDNPTNQ